MTKHSFTVLENDFGIRPAGPPDKCLYCKSKVNEPHGQDCVVIVRRVTYEVSAGIGIVALFEMDEPASWSKDTMRFMRNESNWCCGNMINNNDLIVTNSEAWEALTKDDDCLCSVLNLEPSIIGEEVYRAN